MNSLGGLPAVPPIIDIAEKYGYHSPTAFNRAFQFFDRIVSSSVKGEGVSAPFEKEIQAMMKNNGNILLLFQAQRKPANLKNTLCRPPAMNMPMPLH